MKLRTLNRLIYQTKQFSILCTCVALALLTFQADKATAATIDLTAGPGTSGMVNGVTFEFDSLQPAGTGILVPFVRIQANGTEEGYNTSNPSFPFDEEPPAGGFTRDLPFSELVEMNGEYHFVLDINEANGGTQSLLSLDRVQLYITDTPSQNTTVLGDLGTLVYDLDANEDSEILLDYDNAQGSGTSDMLMRVPASVFASATAGDFIILYSHFGDTHSSGAGFEEWAILVPEPATWLLGFTASLYSLRRRL